MTLSNITSEEMQTYYRVKHALEKARYENMSEEQKKQFRDNRREYMRQYRAKQKAQKVIC